MLKILIWQNFLAYNILRKHRKIRILWGLLGGLLLNKKRFYWILIQKASFFKFLRHTFQKARTLWSFLIICLFFIFFFCLFSLKLIFFHKMFGIFFRFSKDYLIVCRIMWCHNYFFFIDSLAILNLINRGPLMRIFLCHLFY